MKHIPEPGQKQYWRSLESRHSDPTDPAYSPDSEPLGAPSEVTRRTVLGLMGASLAMTGVACRRPEEKIVPYVKAPEHLVPGVPQHFATTMTRGMEVLGVLVESHMGRPTKIEGNELHPGSLGGAHLWAQASMLELYDPDRSHAPQHHEGGGEESTDDHGEHGDGQSSSSATWEDFTTAWQERAGDLDQDGGAKLAFFGTSHCSPTLARMESMVAERWPQARWARWDAAGDQEILTGFERAAGQAVRPVLRLDRARVVLALDADLLQTESGSVAHARGFAEGRRSNANGGDHRLYAVESTMTVTGAAADERIALQSRRIGAFLAAIARALEAEGLSVGLPAGLATDLDAALTARAETIAKDLHKAGAEALVFAGRGQSAAVHAAVLAVNQALGSLGATLELHAAEEAPAAPQGGTITTLVEAMRAGEVDTLVILGGNPIYDAPADLAFGEALAQVAHSVHLSDRVDETSAVCEWHLPSCHWLESWGDARAADGTLSVVQPLIAPLFESRSRIEVLAMLAGIDSKSGHDLVRETWQMGPLAGDLFETQWRKTLHDGFLTAEASASLEIAVAPEAIASDWQSAASAASAGLEVTFRPSNSVFDGRFANNSWLQELPDPITKITWNNAALIAGETARELAVSSGDLVRLTSRERELTAPIFVLPGQAAGSISLALGYGRSAAGRVGSGLGFNASALRHSEAAWIDGEVAVVAAGGSAELVQTQDHWSMEGRNLVREANLEEFAAHPDFASHPDRHLKLGPLWEEFDYSEGYQWGMAIDLNTCIGCNACVVACQSENNIPVVGPDQISKGREMHWLRVDRYFAGDDANPEVVFQPVTCQHCENAPCEQVCPVAATVHDSEGLNGMIYNRCIGTRYCSNNCPYKVRRFNFLNFTKDTPELVKLGMNPNVTVRSRGVMEKCSFCVQRINGTRIANKRDGRGIADGDVRTACQQTCPTQAISFGNLTDTESQVAAEHQDPRAYTLLVELNNKPRIRYLAKLRNPGSQAEQTAADEGAHS